MRLSLLLLGFALAAVQIVTLVDCCCGSLCPHQDRRCTACGDERECTLGRAPSRSPGCCNTDEPSSSSPDEEGCTHINPSTETNLQSTTPDLPPEDEGPVVLRSPDEVARPALEPGEPRTLHPPPRLRPDRAVYLRLHAFLI